VRETKLTAEEMRRDKNISLAFEQERRWQARNYDPAPEAEAMKIAKSFNKKDVSYEELKGFEASHGVYSGYVVAALRKLGYSQFINKDRMPEKYQTCYTLRLICPHCKKPLDGFKKQNN